MSLVLVSGLSLSGHDAVDAGSSKATELADWVHLSAASLWLGGLLSLAVAVWPADRALGREAFYSFSRVAVVLVGLVLLAGTYLAIVRVPHLRDLWTQRYGVVLLIKVSLVAAAVAWGAVHHFFVRPQAEERRRGDARARRPEPRRGEPRRRGCTAGGRGARRFEAAAAARAGRGHPGGGAAPLSSSREPRGVGRRGRLVLVAEEDVGRWAQPLGQRLEVGFRVGRLAQADVAERLGVEVVHGDDPFAARPGVVPEVERELPPGRPLRAPRRGARRRGRSGSRPGWGRAPVAEARDPLEVGAEPLGPREGELRRESEAGRGRRRPIARTAQPTGAGRRWC